MALSLSGDGTLSGVDLAASGLGKVLQVVRATDNTDRSTASTTYVDASISVTISPTKSDSAILLLWWFNFRAANNSFGEFLITDNSNNSLVGGSQGVISGGSNLTAGTFANLVIGYSTPATTSATTYKGRFRSSIVNTGTTTIYNASWAAGQLYAIEVAA
jgi:hypothetical protein